jgi:hypothetical protein
MKETTGTVKFWLKLMMQAGITNSISWLIDNHNMQKIQI